MTINWIKSFLFVFPLLYVISFHHSVLSSVCLRSASSSCWWQPTLTNIDYRQQHSTAPHHPALAAPREAIFFLVSHSEGSNITITSPFSQPSLTASSPYATKQVQEWCGERRGWKDDKNGLYLNNSSFSQWKDLCQSVNRYFRLCIFFCISSNHLFQFALWIRGWITKRNRQPQGVGWSQRTSSACSQWNGVRVERTPMAFELFRFNVGFGWITRPNETSGLSTRKDST